MFLIDPYRLLGWVLLILWIDISGILALTGENPGNTLKDMFKMRGFAALGLCAMFVGVWLVTRGEISV